MQHEFYPTQLRQQYRLLGHAGHWSQMACWHPDSRQQIARELVYGEEAVEAFAKAWNGKGNVFIGRNPRNADGDPCFGTTLSLDIDPIRDKGTAATEDQHQACIAAAKRITQSFNYGIICSSGNGGLILFPLREQVTKDVAERWGKALEAKARTLVEGLNVEIDSTFDLARLAKCMGTLSTKGDPSLHRHARFISDPGERQNADGFYKWLESIPVEPPRTVVLPGIVKGELDRSKADMALAARLKLQGFGPEDTYRALQTYATRPGREDDYRRIVEKVYGNTVNSGGQDKPIELITPQSGLEGYKSRAATGVPEFPTGFAAIDRATFGLTRGSIFTVGARRGAGKTTFAIGTALNLCRAGKRVLYLSTETTYQEVWDRYIACGTGVGAFALQHGLRLNGHQQHVDNFIKEFTEKHNFTVYDGSRPSIGVVRRIVEQAAPEVLLIDYFQHAEARDVKALEEFVMGLLELAKEKNIAILACAQLHDRRNPQTNKPYPPTLNDMKNCKIINDESRVVLLLDWDSEGAKEDGPAAVKVVMAKNRGSKTDCVLKLDRSIPKFIEE